jgi:small-conductance mechanosensitive channel
MTLDQELLYKLLITAAILLAAWLSARVLVFVLGRVVERAARHTETTLDDRLIGALRVPLQFAVFLGGAYVAIHRFELQASWSQRLDHTLFALGVAVVSLAALRAWTILLAWYASDSAAGVESPLAREFSPLLSKLGKVVIVTLAAITLLEHFGVNVSSLVVSLGVGSLAVGLAARDTLANMFAGFTLMLDRPFKLGDRIQLTSGEVGDVAAIGIRATRIRTVDETILVVPNSVLVNERVINLSEPGRHVATRLEVGVAYGSDVARVKQVLSEAALASQHVDREHGVAVLLVRFGESAIQFRVVFRARDYNEQGLALSAVHEEILRRFRAEGIEIPYPVRRLIQGEA